MRRWRCPANQPTVTPHRGNELQRPLVVVQRMCPHHHRQSSPSYAKGEREERGHSCWRKVAAAANTAKLANLFLVMILPQVHLRKPCYDFYFL